MKKRVVALIGPTAVGKTDASIALAKACNGEIINGDALQVYKDLNIGTAKITQEEMQGVPHHLFDLIEADEPYSVAQYQENVRAKMAEIHARGRLPILVGGTGLYVNAVLMDYHFSDEGKDEAFREQLEAEVAEHGIEARYAELVALDPVAAKGIHPNNTRRVIRALEVFHATGKTPTQWQAEQSVEPHYDHVLIGLTMDREQLYERINRRVDVMMERGLLAEVEGLYARGIRDAQSVQAIGYKELMAVLDGRAVLDEAVELVKQQSRRYAKRQLTWFRNKMNVRWFDVTEEREKKIKEMLAFVAGK